MKRCGLLGEKLGHSYSPAIHAELADYEYRLYEVAPEKLGEFLTGGGFDGMNVTIPYKKAVIPYCAELSPIAQKLQSVNVLVRREDGTLYGDNADAYGFAGMVKASGIAVAGKKTGLEIALQLLDGLADGGLADIQRLRRGGDVASFRHFLEYLVEFQFNGHFNHPFISYDDMSIITH